MTYLLVLFAGVILGYAIKKLDVMASDYRGEWADLFTDVPEPSSNVVDVSDTP